MSEFLDEMERRSLLRTRILEQSVGTAVLEDRAVKARPALPLRLDTSGFDVIGEAKLRSPADGRLVEVSGGETVSSLASAVQDGGACAISVLTEESRFEGSLTHLESVARLARVPVMRKDFLTSPLQVLEARAAGASGVLLIARMLHRQLLEEMTDLALAFGMFVLVEVFDLADLSSAEAVFDRDVLVGVNSRDLTTLEVAKGSFETLAPHLPAGRASVAESGVATPDDVSRIAQLGYGLALVGTAMARSEDPLSLMRSLLAAGRSAVPGVAR